MSLGTLISGDPSAPIASKGRPAPAHVHANSELVWRREMEKAQATTWFKGVLHKADLDEDARASSERSSVRPADRNTTIGSPTHARSPQQSTWTHAPVAVNCSVTAASEQPGEALTSAPCPVGTSSTRMVDVKYDRSEVATTQLQVRGVRKESAVKGSPRLNPDIDSKSSAGSAATQHASPPPEREDTLPVRVHVEGDARGATVWLGINAAAQGELPALQATISRWLAQKGYGSPTWICNGRRVEEHAPPDNQTHAPISMQGASLPHQEPLSGERT